MPRRLPAQSNDSLYQPRQAGLGFFTEIGLLNNASLQRVREQLAPLGVTLTGTKANAFGFQVYRRERRADTELRFFFLGNSLENDATNQRQARLNGFGIGLAVVPRLVNTRRWVIGPVLGYDLLRYRLRIDAPTLGTGVPIQAVVANPLPYQSQVLRGNGLTFNVGAAMGYRFRFLPKVYSGWQLNLRLGYHLPAIYSQDWKFDQKTVSGLEAYRPGNLYLHVGLVSFPVYRRRGLWAGQ